MAMLKLKGIKTSVKKVEKVCRGFYESKRKRKKRKKKNKTFSMLKQTEERTKSVEVANNCGLVRVPNLLPAPYI